MKNILLMLMIAFLLISCSKERRVEYYLDMELGNDVGVVFTTTNGVRVDTTASDGWNHMFYPDPGEYFSIHVYPIRTNPKVTLRILVDGDLLYAKTDSGGYPLIVSYTARTPKHNFFLYNN